MHFSFVLWVKFSFSEKATKNCEIFLMVLTFTKLMSKTWERLHKCLWPSKKSWTLKVSKSRKQFMSFSILQRNEQKTLSLFRIVFLPTMTVMSEKFWVKIIVTLRMSSGSSQLEINSVKAKNKVLEQMWTT